MFPSWRGNPNKVFTQFVCLWAKKFMGAHNTLQLFVTDTRSKYRLVINPRVIWHPGVGHFYWLNLSYHNVSQILGGLALHSCYSVRGHDYYVTLVSLCNQLPLSNKKLLSFTDVCQYTILQEVRMWITAIYHVLMTEYIIAFSVRSIICISVLKWPMLPVV